MARTKRGKEFSFEKALKRIEDIVVQLESDQVELERALELHQEAKELTEQCQQILDQTQKKVKRLVGGRNGYRTQDTDLEET